MNQQTDQYYLQQALELAQQRLGFCAPNPSVGAVVVKDGEIIGRGHHYACGEAHAEVNALAGVDAAGATLYVTLEPCCHHGRTPPCTDVIVANKLARVVYGYEDPNPVVAGKSAAICERAGICCEYLPLESIQQFYRYYNHWQRSGLPWVTAKLAISADEKVAGPKGEPIQITGMEAKQFTHEHRLHADAILTSVQTIINDDPQLNVRLDGHDEIAKPLYIIDSQCRLPKDAKVLDSAASICLFHGSDVIDADIHYWQQQGITLIAVKQDSYGLELSQILEYVGECGVHHLWIEAGPSLFRSLLEQRLVQRAYIYQGQTVLGDVAIAAWPQKWLENQELSLADWQPLGNDNYVELIFP